MTISLSKTQAYYDSIRSDSLCQCDYCVNYYRQIKAEYAEVTAFLAHLGIDIEKPFETSPLEPDEQGTIEYSSCQYIVFGTCREEYYTKIGEVEIRPAKHHPTTGMEEAHFVLELQPIRLKWTIE